MYVCDSFLQFVSIYFVRFCKVGMKSWVLHRLIYQSNDAKIDSYRNFNYNNFFPTIYMPFVGTHGDTPDH